MPFKQPWREFQPGDLVYGIEACVMGGKARATYIGAWKAEALPENTPPARVDAYRVLRREQSAEPEAPWERSMKETLLTHPKYKAAVLETAERSSPELNSLVRKKDKGGLYWATLVAGKHVHFILDGLNMESVIHKSFTKKSLPAFATKGKAGKLQYDRPATEGQQKIRSITGSELRWVFRHREHENVEAFVQFWRDGEPCVPPWKHWVHTDPKTYEQSEISAMWNHYQPRNPIQIHHDVVEIPNVTIGVDDGGMQRIAHDDGTKKGCGGCTIF